MAVNEARNAAPSATGTLRRSIVFAPTGVLSGYIGSPLKYAAAQNEGAGAHTIAPKRKKALYNAREGWGPVAGPVEHPGNPATNFLDKAALTFKGFFGAALQKKVRL